MQLSNMLFFLCFRPTIKFQDGSLVDPLSEPSADPPEVPAIRIHTITLMFTIHYLNSRANGSPIASIAFTYSLQSRESWPLRFGLTIAIEV